MYSPPLRSFIALLFTAGLFLTACQVPLPMLPELSDTESMPMAEDAAAEDAATENADAEDVTESEVTESEVTESDVTESDVTASDEAETADAAEGAEADANAGPGATVVVSSLRLRSGPGAEYEIVGSAPAGDTFPITGQAYGCGWLNIEHPTLGSIWMSGAAQFTSMNVDCAEIPEPIEIPTPPPPPPTPEPAPEAPAETAVEPGAESAVAEPAVAEPAAPAETAVEPADPPSESPPGLPNDQGCYLFQNFVGPELNITVTAKDWEWADNFRVPEGGVKEYCFGPGRYAITVDAPPPWNSINIDLNAKAGEHYLFPIERRE